MVSKTKQRILESSLYLFNEEGEANVTTVDIANELDISPGNLYYHYKGKDVIINELFKLFEEQMGDVLRARLDAVLDIEDNWYYLYVIFEEIYKFRFIYRNISNLLSRDEEWRRRFARLIGLKIGAITAICEALREEGLLQLHDDEIRVLSQQAALTLTYWLNFDDLTHPNSDEKLRMHRGVFHIMSIIAPHLNIEQSTFYEQCRTFLREAKSL